MGQEVGDVGEADAHAKAIKGELLGSLFGANRGLFVVSLLLCLIESLFGTFFPVALSTTIDAAAAASLDDIAASALFLVFLIAGANLTKLVYRHFMPLFLKRAVAGYRRVAFSHLLFKGIGSFDGGGQSRYVSALTNDVTTIETTYLERVIPAIGNCLVCVASFFILLVVSVPLAVTATAGAVIAVVVSTLSGKRLAERQSATSARNERFVAQVADLISGFPLIKSFFAEGPAQTLFDASNEDLEESKVGRRRTEQTIQIVSNLGFNFATLSVMFFAAYLCATGQGVTPGNIYMVSQLMVRIAEPIGELPGVLAARGAARDLTGRLAVALASDCGEGGSADVPESLGEGISLEHVGFAYEEGKEVLSDLSVRFPAGSCNALVGASGSGKSTLLSLLMGAQGDYDGSISYDDVELRDASRESLYRTVSLVRQDTFLFDATLRENVTMFADVDEGRVREALAKAGLKDFVEEHGLDYPCGEGGSNLSGGERQRVCIARSLLRGLSVLLFDEATSALDQATADQITRSVLDLTGTTRVIVTHRLDAAQLKRFDGIVVLRDGRVCEQGTFDELMAKDGYFKALYTVGQ